MTFETLDDVKEAVKNGAIVCWETTDYRVVIDLFNDFQIAYRPWSKSPNYVGLTADYNASEFFPYNPE